MATYDVVGQYDWTSAPRGSGIRGNAPKVYVRSFKVNTSESLERLISYFKATSKSDPDEFYQNLYGNVTEQEDTFSFPLLTDTIRSFSNNYGDAFNSEAMGALDKVINESIKLLSEAGSIFTSFVAKAGSNNVEAMPGVNVEPPKLYQYEANDAPLEVSFVLSNTINPGAWRDNHKLMMKLTEINRPERLSFTFMRPPRIYKVRVPGVRFMEWASCASFSVQFLGTKRELEGILVPEGYLISMSFAPLTIEVNNFIKRFKRV